MPTQAAFHIHRSADGQYYFHLIASTEDNVLRSENYTTHAACLNGITSVKAHAPHEQYYQRGTQADYRPYYNLLASNRQVIGTRLNISNATERERLIGLCKSEAAGASTEDRS